MARDRVVKEIFIDNGTVFGPGRYKLGVSGRYLKAADYEPADADTIPKGIAVHVGIDGLRPAIEEVRQRSGLPPLTQ